MALPVQGDTGSAISTGALNAPVVEARSLTLEYETERGTVLAVDAVDFSIAERERLVLLGPSGCGKSSILRAVAGFLAPTGGSIHVRGLPVSGPGPDRIVVFQEFDQLLPWKTVRENVAFPLRIARGLSSAEAREAAEAALDKVGLASFLDAYPHTLSGGMKQRTAIARALATEPDVLLMDEPFAALDALTRRKLQDDLVALADELRFTVLFVTHSIDEAVLVGTTLHLLSAHPGGTIGTFDTGALGVDAIGTAAFAAVTRDVHELLFSDRIDAHDRRH